METLRVFSFATCGAYRMTAQAGATVAARINRRHSDEIRAKIQASCLIHRLHQCAIGEIDLTPTQLNAINSLLDRSVPKLQTVQHVGGEKDDAPIQHKMTLEFVDAGAVPGKT